jgi:hypothetical protein
LYTETSAFFTAKQLIQKRYTFSISFLPSTGLFQKKMIKYLLCLIGVAGILAFTQINQNETTGHTPEGEKGICFFESAANPPLSAIENTLYNLSPVNSDFKNFSGQKTTISSPEKHLRGYISEINSEKSVKFVSAKSTSLFRLFHASLSLLKVIRC